MGESTLPKYRYMGSKKLLSLEHYGVGFPGYYFDGKNVYSVKTIGRYGYFSDKIQRKIKVQCNKGKKGYVHVKLYSCSNSTAHTVNIKSLEKYYESVMGN